MDFPTWMKETEEMKRVMALRALETTVREMGEKKKAKAKKPSFKMTTAEREFNYISETVEYENTSETYLFFLFVIFKETKVQIKIISSIS